MYLYKILPLFTRVLIWSHRILELGGVSDQLLSYAQAHPTRSLNREQEQRAGETGHSAQARSWPNWV